MIQYQSCKGTNSEWMHYGPSFSSPPLLCGAFQCNVCLQGWNTKPDFSFKMSSKKGEFLFLNECNAVGPFLALLPFFVEHHNVSRHKRPPPMSAAESHLLTQAGKWDENFSWICSQRHQGWTERDSSCTLGKEEEEEEEKQSSKELIPSFTPFPALEPLAYSRLKHIGLQSAHSNDQAPQNHESDHKNTKSAGCNGGALRPDGL